ncbi:MAG TPA: hypothetical protein VJI15_03970 [Candidatus Nanoarchaeia archaeon]|nr:hypothetical protein [Candidatus Nanoarchaeia archaeon]
MNVEELKHNIRIIFGSEIVFNKEFDRFALNIKNIETNLIEWCTMLKEGQFVPLRPPNSSGERVFVKRIGSANRCIVIKIVNGEFTEIHLADHSYYEKKMKELGLKKSSKTY